MTASNHQDAALHQMSSADIRPFPTRALQPLAPPAQAMKRLSGHAVIGQPRSRAHAVPNQRSGSASVPLKHDMQPRRKITSEAGSRQSQGRATKKHTAVNQPSSDAQPCLGAQERRKVWANLQKTMLIHRSHARVIICLQAAHARPAFHQQVCVPHSGHRVQMCQGHHGRLSFLDPKPL